MAEEMNTSAFADGHEQPVSLTRDEAYDLAMHLAGVHGNTAAIGNTPAENTGLHRDEHLGPGGIRNHPFRDRRYVPEKVEEALEEAECAEGIPGAGCPDGGTCHHDCTRACFRVLSCGPLSGAFEGDRWPEAVAQAHRKAEGD